MLTPVEKILFLACVVVSLSSGFWGFRTIFRVIRRGQGAFDSKRVLQNLRRAAVHWLTLRPTWRTRRSTSLLHALVAWSFTFYLLVNLGDVIEGFFPVTFLGENFFGNSYRLLADVLSVAALIAMAYFLVRRFVLRAPALTFRENIKILPAARNGLTRDSLIVGAFIFGHIGARFLGQSVEVALARASTGASDFWQPFANAVSLFLVSANPTALLAAHHVFWWLALGLILLFIPYFPRTKHLHLIMSGVNFLTKPARSSRGALEPINFDDENVEQFGASRLEHLQWTHLVDAYACIMCNRCQDVCPAYVTGKELSPAALEVNKRYYINENANLLAVGQPSSLSLLDFAISESALWACTACGACIDVCPVGNEPMFDILHIRRNQVLMENEFPSQLQNAFKGMERAGNPWNLPRGNRMAWADGLNVRTVAENPDFDVLWWVGCAPSYDGRAQKTARDFATLLDAAGVNFAVLGERENCTGDSARRAGNEALFFEHAQANIETLNDVKPKRIVTTCPHCLHTLGKEYPQYGGHYEVVHHTELLAELLDKNQLRSDLSAVGATTFHDPCYLGRHNGIFESPRAALTQSKISLVEMEHHRNQSFCCGAGGGQMWKEEEPGQESVSTRRLQEASATGAQTLAVGCPFCLTMLTDAATRAGQSMVVKDVAELLVEGMQQQKQS